MSKIMAWGISQNTGAGNAHSIWFATESAREEYYYDHVNKYAGCNRLDPNEVDRCKVIPSYEEYLEWCDDYRYFNTPREERPAWVEFA